MRPACSQRLSAPWSRAPSDTAPDVPLQQVQLPRAGLCLTQIKKQMAQFPVTSTAARSSKPLESGAGPASCPAHRLHVRLMLKEPERSSEKRWPQGLPSSRTTCSSSPAWALGSEGSAQNRTHPRPQPRQHRTHSVTHRTRSESRPGTRAPGAGSGTGPPVRWSPAPRPGLPPGDLRRKKRAPSEWELTATQPPLRLCIEEKQFARVQQRPA